MSRERPEGRIATPPPPSSATTLVTVDVPRLPPPSADHVRETTPTVRAGRVRP